LWAGASRAINKENRGVITPSPSTSQAPHHLAVRPSAAEVRNELLAKAALAPEAIPGVRNATTRLLAVRAISAEELQRAPPETRGTHDGADHKKIPDRDANRGRAIISIRCRANRRVDGCQRSVQ